MTIKVRRKYEPMLHSWNVYNVSTYNLLHYSIYACVCIVLLIKCNIRTTF